MKRYKYSTPDPKKGVAYVDILDDGNVVLHCVDGKSRLSKSADIYRGDVMHNKKYKEVDLCSDL